MLIELFLALIIGILIGTLTGLTPGIHINLVSALVLSFLSLLLLHFQPLSIVIFLVALSITHTFIDYIPSIFLGAPDENNFLAILPGHELLLKGKAYHAVVYTLYGSIMGIILILLFSPIFFFLLPKIYPYAERIMPLILIIASFFLIYFEKSSKLWAFLIFCLSGILGLVTLNLPLKESLLPLFTGLFGISSLITSITKKQTLPKQIISKLKSIRLKLSSIFRVFIASSIASPLCSFLPGMGSGQAAVIGSEVTGNLDRKEFLVLLGSISTIVMGLSFITLYTIGKARTGVAAAVKNILELSVKDLFIITLAIVITGILSFFLTLFFAKIFSRIISKINYRKISIVIMFLLILITLFISGWLGLLVLAVSTCLGLLCIYAGIRRTHMLGSLIIPALVLFLL